MLCITDSLTNYWIDTQSGSSTWIGNSQEASDSSEREQYSVMTGCSSSYSNWNIDELNNSDSIGGFVRLMNKEWSKVPFKTELPCSCEYMVAPALSIIPSDPYTASPTSPSLDSSVDQSFLPSNSLIS